jgi:hypothetical protein
MQQQFTNIATQTGVNEISLTFTKNNTEYTVGGDGRLHGGGFNGEQLDVPDLALPTFEGKGFQPNAEPKKPTYKESLLSWWSSAPVLLKIPSIIFGLLFGWIGHLWNVYQTYPEKLAEHRQKEEIRWAQFGAEEKARYDKHIKTYHEELAKWQKKVQLKAQNVIDAKPAQQQAPKDATQIQGQTGNPNQIDLSCVPHGNGGSLLSPNFHEQSSLDFRQALVDQQLKQILHSIPYDDEAHAIITNAFKNSAAVRDRYFIADSAGFHPELPNLFKEQCNINAEKAVQDRNLASWARGVLQSNTSQLPQPQSHIAYNPQPNVVMTQKNR